MYRSFANMPPGGFYVGGTTGWMVNGTDAEYLRRAAGTHSTRFALGRADASRPLRYRINVTQAAYYYLSAR